jgi:hypothetical protein
MSKNKYHYVEIYCNVIVIYLTPTGPLPPRPDIPSPQTGPFDSVNSPGSILLAPVEKPNIPSSIEDRNNCGFHF